MEIGTSSYVKLLSDRLAQRAVFQVLPCSTHPTAGPDMTLSRLWPAWIVLLCLHLTLADRTACHAAEPYQAATPAAVVPVAVAPTAAAPAADVPAKAEAKAAAPAKKRGLMGTILKALGDDSEERAKRAKAAEDQNIRTWEAEIRPQFQQLLYVELAFVRRVAKPDAKTFAAIAKSADAGLEAPLREFVVANYISPRRGSERANVADPRSAMQKLLSPLVKEKLGPEKVELYRQECDKRAEARKHAVIMNLVAVLDERLVLTAPQRAKLVQSLSANYEHSWDQFYEVYGIRSQYLPSIRDKSIVALLDDQQKSVWKQTNKIEGETVSSQIMTDNNMPDGVATEVQEIAQIIEEGKSEK